MGRSFHLLLDDVLTREKRNRGIVLLFVIASATTSLMFLYVLSRFYPRWCAYVAIPLVPATLYWVARSGVRSAKVSRLEAAALIDSTLDTRDRGATLVELEQSPEPNHKAHIDLLSRQLSTIIPFTTSSKTINPYTLGQAERRAIIISVLASILCVLLVAFRPLSTRERIAQEIESALADLPGPQPQVQEMAQRVIDTMRNPSSSHSDIQSAIQDAKLALKNAPSTTPQESRTSVVITPSSQNNAAGPKPAITPSAAQPPTQPLQKDAPKPPSAPKSEASRRESQDSKNEQKKEESQERREQQDQQQQSSSSPSDEKSKESGAGQQRSGEGDQGDSPSDSSQSESQKEPSEKDESTSDSSQKSKSNDSSNKQSDQSNEQQSGGSQGSGSGKGSAGSDSSDDAQQESSSGGSGSGKSGKGGGEQKGEHEQQSSNDSNDASEGEGSGEQSGAQKLSQALDKAAQSLHGESTGDAGKAPPSSQSDGESSQDQGSESGAQGQKEASDKARQAENKAKGNDASDQKSSEGSGKEQDKDSKNSDPPSRATSSEKPGDSREQDKASQPESKGEPNSPKDAKDSKRQGFPGTSEQGDEAKEQKNQKEQQTSNTHGNQDAKGEKSRIVEGKATPRHYEEGGPDGPPGAGLGGKEGFKDVQLGNTKESFDTRFTGQDSTEEEGKGPAQPKTTIEDLTLSKPKSSVDRGEQRIPLEYKDIIR